jgi:hypothetical protein
MKIKDIILLEARKNPDQNPKLTPDEQLDQIVERYGAYNLFVRLSGVPKFGANPTAEYNTTPLGLYAYPADYTIDNGINELPYPLPDSPDSRYVVVFKLMPNAIVWNLEDDDPNILKRVQTVCSKLINQSAKRDAFNKLLAEPNSTPDAKDFETIREWFLSGDSYDISRPNQQLFEYALDNELKDSLEKWWQKDFDKKWQARREKAIRAFLPDILEDKGVDADVDQLIKEAISDPDNEYSIAVYNLVADTEWEDIQESEWEHADLENEYLRARRIFTMQDFADFYTSLAMPKQTSTDVHSSAGLWEWIKTTHDIHGKTPSRFRKILLKAGIDVVIDPGLSIIHDAEPTQSVFLTINKVKQVGLIDKRRTGNPIRLSKWTKEKQFPTPMPDTTRSQWLTAVKNGQHSLMDVPLALRDYKMCLAAIKVNRAHVAAIPTTLEKNQYNDLIHRVVLRNPYEIQLVKRGSIPEDDYVALWKQSMLEQPTLWRQIPDDIKDILLPGWNAKSTAEAERVRKLVDQWKRAIAANPEHWKLVPDDIKTMIAPNWASQQNEEVDRVKELAERLLR